MDVACVDWGRVIGWDAEFGLINGEGEREGEHESGFCVFSQEADFFRGEAGTRG